MGSPSKNIIVLRFSAMGDVALLAPVLRSFLSAYPNHQLTLATRPRFSVFFSGQDRLLCFPADVDSEYSGLTGLFKLFFALKKTKPETVLDLHDHIRTRFICFLFRLSGVKIVRFDKGRKEKNALTRKENKIRSSLPHTVQRYREAFVKAGFSFSILPSPYFKVSAEAESNLNQWLESNRLVKNESWFGLAPFAAHKSKIWPLENYSSLILQIKEKMPVKFFLFGGGRNEIEFFQLLKKQFPHDCVLVAGDLKLPEELALMKMLDKMICVDSANMHLAALLGIPTLSIWGGTHTDAGFGPFGNENSAKVQVDINELSCRPCSVYGKETCHRGDFACMARIKPEEVVKHVSLPVRQAGSFPVL